MAGLVEDTLPVHTKDHDESKLAIAGYLLLLLLLFLFFFPNSLVDRNSHLTVNKLGVQSLNTGSSIYFAIVLPTELSSGHVSRYFILVKSLS